MPECVKSDLKTVIADDETSGLWTPERIDEGCFLLAFETRSKYSPIRLAELAIRSVPNVSREPFKDTKVRKV